MSRPRVTLTHLRSIFHGRAATGSASARGIPAAIFVPFAGDGESPRLVLTRRSRQVKHHKGEMAFPGGMREPGDESHAATAIRETVEELGVAEDAVTVWGELEPIMTTTGYALSAFIGKLRLEGELSLSAREVEELVTVPVDWLLNPSSMRDETRMEGDRLNSRPTYSYNGHIIWGATARVLTSVIDEIRRHMSTPCPDQSREGSTPTEFRQ